MQSIKCRAYHSAANDEQKYKRKYICNLIELKHGDQDHDRQTSTMSLASLDVSLALEIRSSCHYGEEPETLLMPMELPKSAVNPKCDEHEELGMM